MRFYKLILQVGHCGRGYYKELTIYLHASSHMRARDKALKFPMVKHDKTDAIISSKEVGEFDFVIGNLQSGYKEVAYGANEIEDLGKLARRLNFMGEYKFETEEGKQLKCFCDRYNNADDKTKKLIEKEYIGWATTQIDKYSDQFGF